MAVRFVSRVAPLAHARAFSTSAPKANDGSLFLGFDSSTQGLKVTAVNQSMDTVYNTAINFDAALPAYKTTGGFHQHANDVVTAPTLMFAEALDIVLAQMKKDGFEFDKVAAISGSGQQHGSVYWANGAHATLSNLQAGHSFSAQLKDSFSFADSPIWRDSSTTAECRALEAAVGGPQELSTISGSRGYERFTGNQIMKLAAASPDTYNNTERISLISSFMCSLFLGDYAGVDTSDGAGMNMMDLQAQAWSAPLLEAIAPGLASKMGDVVPGHESLGKVSGYLTEEYGFNPACSVIAWSGDNPNSVAGLGLRNPGDVGLSLGTSDTIFSIMDATTSKPGLEGHIFVNPVDPASHMAMLCYKNGSLAREGVRNRVADGSWDTFDEMISSTAPGNDGNIGFFIDEPEIIPDIPVAGVRRFDASGPVDSFAPEVEARAVVEGQMLSMRLHVQQIGVSPSMLITTGGASANKSITKIMADVFGTDVLASSQTDSASLGAALRAKHGFACEEAGSFVPYAEVTEGCPAMSYSTVAEPCMDAHATYTAMLEQYKAREDEVVGSC